MLLDAREHETVRTPKGVFERISARPKFRFRFRFWPRLAVSVKFRFRPKPLKNRPNRNRNFFQFFANFVVKNIQTKYDANNLLQK